MRINLQSLITLIKEIKAMNYYSNTIYKDFNNKFEQFRDIAVIKQDIINELGSIIENIEDYSKEFVKSAEKSISITNTLSVQLQYFLNTFEQVSQYNRAIGNVIEVIEETSEDLHSLYDKFKENSENLGKMAKSVNQLALNTIIKSFRSQSGKNAVAVIAENITNSADQIVDIIESFESDLKKYENFSQIIRNFTNVIANSNNSISENINKINEIINVYNEFSKKIKNIIYELKDFNIYIDTRIAVLKEIRNTLNSMFEKLTQNDKVNSLKLRELFGIFDMLNDIITELNDLSNFAKKMIENDKKYFYIDYDIKQFSPYKIRSIFDLFINRMLFGHLIEYKDGIAIPSMAKNWFFFKTKKLLIINLREDLRFSDGSEMTAEDVKYSIEMYVKNTKDEEFLNVIGAKDFLNGKTESIEGIKIFSKYSIKVEFNKFSTNSIYYFAKPTMIIIKSEKSSKINELTSGLYVLKKNRLIPNKNHFLYNEFLKEIIFKKNDEAIQLNDAGTEYPVGKSFLFLTGLLNDNQRLTLFHYIMKRKKLTNFLNKEISIDRPAMDNIIFPEKLIIYEKEQIEDIHEVLAQFCKEKGIKCQFYKRKRKNYHIKIDKYFVYYPFPEMIFKLLEQTSNVFKAQIKMSNFGTIFQYEDELIKECYLFPFEDIMEKIYKPEFVELNFKLNEGIKKIEISNLQKIDKKPINLHTLKLLKYFVNSYENISQKIFRDIEYFKNTYSEDYNELIVEYDFFQSGIEEFTNIIEKIKILKQKFKPIKALDFYKVDLDLLVFNNLKLNMNSFLQNIVLYKEFLENFRKKIESIFSILKRINNISYFSAIEAEKNPEIKLDIQSIISEIRHITKDNTQYNLDIKMLLEESILAIKSLERSINMSLNNLDIIIESIQNIQTVDKKLEEKRNEIQTHFNNIDDYMDNINNFAELSLGKINELYSLFRESENYFNSSIRNLSFMYILLKDYKKIDKNNDLEIVDKNSTIEFKNLRTLNISLNNYPITFNPLFATDNTTLKFANLIHSSLFSIDSDLNLIPLLVDDWRIEDNGYSARFKLKKNLYFSNGEPLTTRDIQYTFQKIFNPKNPSPTMNMFTNIKGSEEFAKGETPFIEGLEIVDDYNFIFHFNKIYIPFYLNLGTVYSSILWHGNKFSDNIYPIGIGDFVIESAGNSEIILKKNPYSPLKYDNFDYIHIKIMNNDKEVEKTFLKNELDYFTPSSNYIDDMKKGKKIVNGNIFSLSQLNLRYMGINIKSRPEFGLQEVRQAIFYAINHAKLISERRKNTAIMADGILPPNIEGHIDSHFYKYNPDKAKELLNQAGLKHGIKTPILLYFLNNEEQGEMARAIKRNLEDINISVELKPVSWKELLEACEDGRVQLFFLGWISDNGDPDSFLYTLFHSNNIGNSGNYFNYGNEIVDDFLNRAMSSLNMKERIQFYNKAERQIMEDAIIYPITYSLTYAITKKYLHGFKLHPLDFLKIQLWWKL